MEHRGEERTGFNLEREQPRQVFAVLSHIYLSVHERIQIMLAAVQACYQTWNISLQKCALPTLEMKKRRHQVHFPNLFEPSKPINHLMKKKFHQQLEELLVV